MEGCQIPSCIPEARIFSDDDLKRFVSSKGLPTEAEIDAFRYQAQALTNTFIGDARSWSTHQLTTAREFLVEVKSCKPGKLRCFNQQQKGFPNHKRTTTLKDSTRPIKYIQ